MVWFFSIRSRVLGYLCVLAAGFLVIGLKGMAAGAGAAPLAPERHDAACVTSPSTLGLPDPLDGICAYLSGRQGVVQVALFDATNGNAYLLSNGDDNQYTASIVKVNIVAERLHHYQLQGTQIPDGIPDSIRLLMQAAIENSANAATTTLFEAGGGCNGLTQFHNLIPLTDTTVGCATPTYYGWGNTITTAADQNALVKILAYGGRDDILGSDARSYELQLMQNVQPDQRFGITCGPWGNSCAPPDYASPVAGVTVALKNGWKTLPTCTKPIPECPWQVNSTGWVAGEGRNYVLTVLTTEDPVGLGDLYGLRYGIDTIQSISAMIWANLGRPPTPTPTPTPTAAATPLPSSPPGRPGPATGFGGLPGLPNTGRRPGTPGPAGHP